MTLLTTPKKLLLAALAAASLGALAIPAQAQVLVQPGMVVQTMPPPPPRYEVVPGPRPGFVWTPGYWVSYGPHPHWRPGYWVRARPGYVYAPPAWRQHGDHWRREPGRWDRR